MDFLFFYIINHNELNSSGKSRKRRFFLKKNGVASENKAVWGEKYPQKREKAFLRVQRKGCVWKDARHRLTVDVFDADEERLATVVPVCFAASFAFSALS